MAVVPVIVNVTNVHNHSQTIDSKADFDIIAMIDE